MDIDGGALSANQERPARGGAVPDEARARTSAEDDRGAGRGARRVPPAGAPAAPVPARNPDHQGLRRAFHGVTQVAFEARDQGDLDLARLDENLQAIAAIAERLAVPHQARIAGALRDIQDRAETEGRVDLQALHRVVLHLAHFARNHPRPEQPIPLPDGTPAGFGTGRSAESPALDIVV